MKRECAANIITALLVIVFVFAGTIALLNYGGFRDQLSGFPLTTDYAAGLAWRLPAFQLILSYFLLWPKTRVKAMYASFVLLFTIAVYMVLMINGLYDMPFMSPALFAMNIILLLLTITGIIASKKTLVAIPA
ncbi:hypothetical protein GFS24_23690 [Chitinophaga sp. SYP-B3965]|uniref:MauE/DoxX family redox-associated membrane protein n=1 Tax=Chitinophaga sp. SYP-B3965 TaxID=2663120 RepID=UPI0012998E2A|nr:MauE/DoxX family redox-associated membrane protein [Chitinophaga sp. SYP-B3965]MRG48143.1 hypothetical protein [Chitinophaga sp. SYP-B3965]